MCQIFIVIMGTFIFLFTGIFVKQAYAYIDLGTGSYIFQLFIASAVGGLFAIKMFWGKIVFFFKNLLSKGKK